LVYADGFTPSFLREIATTCSAKPRTWGGAFSGESYVGKKRRVKRDEGKKAERKGRGRIGGRNDGQHAKKNSQSKPKQVAMA